MTKRHCIFAWTEPSDGGHYPAYISINREIDGRVTVHVRAPRRDPGTSDHTQPFPLPGHEATITLPDEVVYDLGAHLETWDVVDKHLLAGQ